MNYKKYLRAFTLTEISIVMTIVGVIGALTMPQMLAGADEAQFKAAYKKAYTVASNVAAILKSNDDLPEANDATALFNVFKVIDKNIEVEGYALNTHTINAGVKLEPSGIKPAVSYNGKQFGSGASIGTVATAVAGTWSPWIVAADGMAFAVNTGSGCGEKSDINAPDTDVTTALSKACVIIAVDVNGLGKLPNKLETQVTSGIASNTRYDRLRGDRYYIYLTKNGVAKGSNLTISGRILSNER